MWVVKLTGNAANKQRALLIWGDKFFDEQLRRTYSYKKDALGLYRAMTLKGIVSDMYKSPKR